MTLKLVFGKLEYLLNGQRLRVGRSEHLDVSIKGDPLVSSNHCIITNGVLVDAGSTNGTYINSQRVTYNKKVQLCAGDVVTLGESKLFIVDASKAAIGAGLPDGQTEPSMNARDISERYVDGEKPKNGDNSNGDASSSTNGTQSGTNTVLMSTLRRSSTERKTVTFSEQIHAQDPKPIPPKGEDESSSDDEVQHTGTGGDEGDDFEGSDEAAEMTENSPHANAGLNAPAGAATNGTDEDLTVGVGSPGGSNGENGVVGSPSDNGNNEDPMQWLPKRDSQLGITPMKSATATLPAPLRASDGSTIKATIPPPGISPEAFQPPADAKSNGAPGSAEEQVWSLQQQLQRAEAKYLQLKKKMNFQQRRQNLTQNKARMQKFESKVADLEFQLLYGDTMKDRELTRVSREMKDLEAKLQQASAPSKSLVEDAEYQRVVKELSELKTSYDDVKRKEEIGQAKITQLEMELKDSRSHAEDAETRVTIATRALSELSGDKALARDQKLAGLVTEQVCSRVSDQVAGQVAERVGSTVSDRVSQSVSDRVAGRLSSDVKAVVKQEVSASVQSISQTVTAVQKGFSSVESNVAQLRTILYALAAVLVVVFLLLLMK